jgi:hypothetical protein
MNSTEHMPNKKKNISGLDSQLPIL